MGKQYYDYSGRCTGPYAIVKTKEGYTIAKVQRLNMTTVQVQRFSDAIPRKHLRDAKEDFSAMLQDMRGRLL